MDKPTDQGPDTMDEHAKGEIINPPDVWTCSDCGRTNGESRSICINCGHVKPWPADGGEQIHPPPAAEPAPACTCHYVHGDLPRSRHAEGCAITLSAAEPAMQSTCEFMDLWARLDKREDRDELARLVKRWLPHAADNSAGVGSGFENNATTQDQGGQHLTPTPPIGGMKNPPDVVKVAKAVRNAWYEFKRAEGLYESPGLHRMNAAILELVKALDREPLPAAEPAGVPPDVANRCRALVLAVSYADVTAELQNEAHRLYRLLCNPTAAEPAGVCQCASERTPEATIRRGPHHQLSCPMYAEPAIALRSYALRPDVLLRLATGIEELIVASAHPDRAKETLPLWPVTEILRNLAADRSPKPEADTVEAGT